MAYPPDDGASAQVSRRARGGESWRRTAAAGLVVIATGAGLLAVRSPELAESFVRKLRVIDRQGDVIVRGDRALPRPTRRTAVSEDEVNSWFAYRATPMLPRGLANPSLRLVGQGKVEGSVTVDLDAIGRARANGQTLDPWRLLGGQATVHVGGVLRSAGGTARFFLDQADLGGVPVPRLVIQELVAYYSRSPERPDGVRLDDPFTLPAGIDRIEIGPAQATVVQ